MNKLMIIKCDNHIFHFPSTHKFVYRITNVMRNSDSAISFYLRMYDNNYKQVLIDNFNALDSNHGCFFEKKKDAFRALDWLEAYEIAQKLSL